MRCEAECFNSDDIYGVHAQSVSAHYMPTLDNKTLNGTILVRTHVVWCFVFSDTVFLGVIGLHFSFHYTLHSCMHTFHL